MDVDGFLCAQHGFNEGASQSRDFKILSQGNNFKDILELLSFGVPTLTQDDAHCIVRTAAIECENEDIWYQLFDFIHKQHPDIWNVNKATLALTDYGVTPLMHYVIFGHHKKHFIHRMQQILRQSDINIDNSIIGKLCTVSDRGNLK
eukprot:834930_1